MTPLTRSTLIAGERTTFESRFQHFWTPLTVYDDRWMNYLFCGPIRFYNNHLVSRREAWFYPCSGAMGLLVCCLNQRRTPIEPSKYISIWWLEPFKLSFHINMFSTRAGTVLNSPQAIPFCIYMYIRALSDFRGRAVYRLYWLHKSSRAARPAYSNYCYFQG